MKDETMTDSLKSAQDNFDKLCRIKDEYPALNIQDKYIHAVNESIGRYSTGTYQVAFVGQMKAGKSTLMNAIIFSKEILPAASTPATAKLTMIRHSERSYALIKFYSKDEWAKLVELAETECVGADKVKKMMEIGNRDVQEIWANLKTNIKDAKKALSNEENISFKRIIDAAHRIPDFKRYLGTEIEISLENLSQYISDARKQGSDANINDNVQYTPIVQSAEIYYPSHWPHNNEFVDTPGTNDPDPVRDQLTKQYLAKADAVVMLLYAGQPGGREDLNFIQNNLLNVGVNKVFLVASKYDLVAGECVSVTDYLRDWIKTTMKSIDQKDAPDSFNNVINIERVYGVSGLAALLGRSEKKIRQGEFYWRKNVVEKFGVNDFKAAIDKSGIVSFENDLRSFLLNTKGKELLNNVINKVNSLCIETEKSVIQLVRSKEEQISLLRKSYEDAKSEYNSKYSELNRTEEFFSEIKFKIQEKIDEYLDKTEKDNLKRVHELLNNIQTLYRSKIDNIRKVSAGTSSAHIVGINTDLSWRMRDISEDTLQIYIEKIIKLKNSIDEEVQDSLREYDIKFSTSHCYKEKIRQIGKYEPNIQLSSINTVQDSKGFMSGLKAIIWTDDYRGELFKQLSSNALEYERLNKQDIKKVNTKVSEDLMAIVDDILKDIQNGLSERLKAIKELVENLKSQNYDREKQQNILQQEIKVLNTEVKPEIKVIKEAMNKIWGM